MRDAGLTWEFTVRMMMTSLVPTTTATIFELYDHEHKQALYCDEYLPGNYSDASPDLYPMKGAYSKIVHELLSAFIALPQGLLRHPFKMQISHDPRCVTPKVV